MFVDRRKAQYALRSNSGAGAAARQADTLPTTATFAVSWRRDVAHALGQASFRVLEQHDKTLRQRRDVARAAGAGEPRELVACSDLRGIQIAEAVHFGSAEEAQMH